MCLMASAEVSLVHPRMTRMPSFWITPTLLSWVAESVRIPSPYAMTDRTRDWKMMKRILCGILAHVNVFKAFKPFHDR